MVDLIARAMAVTRNGTGGSGGSSGSGITDAPENGVQYARKNGNWEPVSIPATELADRKAFCTSYTLAPVDVGSVLQIPADVTGPYLRVGSYVVDTAKTIAIINSINNNEMTVVSSIGSSVCPSITNPGFVMMGGDANFSSAYPNFIGATLYGQGYFPSLGSFYCAINVDRSGMGTDPNQPQPGLSCVIVRDYDQTNWAGYGIIVGADAYPKHKFWTYTTLCVKSNPATTAGWIFSFTIKTDRTKPQKSLNNFQNLFDLIYSEEFDFVTGQYNENSLAAGNIGIVTNVIAQRLSGVQDRIRIYYQKQNTTNMARVSTYFVQNDGATWTQT